MVFDYTQTDRAVVLFCTRKSGTKTHVMPETFSKLLDWAYFTLDRHFVNIL